MIRIDLRKFKNLIHINCAKNEITTLNNFPERLKKLICSFNKISSLHDLPENLEILDISFNNYSAPLDNLASKLKYLNCSGNNKIDNLSY